GNFACINIGDATRKIGDDFKLYSNHFRILQSCHQIGFDILPVILWKKQTNSPNKFMGSGMLPAGAYVTLEHEYILILRKGSKRKFKSNNDKENRQKSAFFWEERNNWFSDIWDFKGIKQQLNNGKTRNRSAAFPFELAYRLINMYSVKGDIVLDPFLGTGTTTIASIASERNSIGFDIDSHFRDEIFLSIQSACKFINSYIHERLEKHLKFVEKCQLEKKKLKYENEFYQFPIMTKQEIKLKLNYVKELSLHKDDSIIALYSDKKKPPLRVKLSKNEMELPVNQLF
ncbi:MAG: site-specific DNA-methyltransferase, partial [Spirochaetota bacterium]|nr:site-specific DNA-methyltransferase [Spirochaetota bacterium]